MFVLQDGGGLSTTTDLVINVKDVQDTAPFFVNLPYIAEVYEDQPVVCILVECTTIPANTIHLYNIYTMLDQRQRRWADVV